MNILVVIPARGGSKGIPRKNIRFIGGKPLIAHAISCVKNCKYDMDVVVSSDDDEIKYVAGCYGADVLDRPESLAGDKITLDPVIYHATITMEERLAKKYDCVITMQPTSPMLASDTLERAIDDFVNKGFDTVLSGVNDPRLSWREENGKCVPNYKERLNRQYMPKDLKETGAFVITKREFVKENSRFGNNVSVFEVPVSQSTDIDTVQDWCVVEMELNKKNIIIRTDGYPQIGMGHIYRGLQLAYGFMEHNIRFVLSDKSKLGIEKISNSHYPFDVISDNEELFDLIAKYKADIVINDILNTDTEYIDALKETGVRVINFEDLGPGMNNADACINCLYEGEEKENVYWGSDYFLIRDEFVIAKPKEFSDTVKEILVLFGGTDPNNLTEKTVKALMNISQNVHITVILGMGYSRYDEINALVENAGNITVVKDVKLMTEYMQKADIAVSSQGRTMLELAAMGVPTILMSQNAREANHEFGSIRNGFLNLGSGNKVEINTIYETIQWLIACPQIRKNMHIQMLEKDLKHGMKRVKKIIMGENND